MGKVFSSLLFVVVVGGAATACMASGSAQYSASATMPDLIEISPGVQVIADYDEPVFYSSNAYWRYDGGVWYQSHTHTGGWVRATPPAAVVTIQQPSMYVHYHASARAGAQVTGQPATMRQERHDEKREDQQERREEKEERREDKHDDKDKGHKGNRK
jgi:hypothetical protein